MRREVGIALALAAFLACPPAARAACDPAPPLTYSTGGTALTTGPTNDPLFPKQWALAQIKAPVAWERGFRGRGAIIAVLDSGVDQAHPDLVAALLPGFDVFAQVTGRPDCPPGPEDDTGHGTHVAGIAAATGGNGIGVAGVAPQAKLLPVKVGDENGSTVEAIAAGIRYAADQGADVASLSVAQTESSVTPGASAAPLEPQMEQAVDYAWSKGTVVVGAAGNQSTPLCIYPAAASKALCVTASDRMGKPPSYSNAGADPDNGMSVRAPGGGGTAGTVDLCEDNVLSTIWPKSSMGSCYRDQGVRGYETLAGTSMAAPHVAGLVGLLAAAGLSAQEIVDRIRATAAPPFGIVDADAATKGLPVPAPATASSPPAGAPDETRQSSAERRCKQARATLKQRDRALRSARRAVRRARGKTARRRARRVVARRAAERRAAAKDVARRCR